MEFKVQVDEGEEIPECVYFTKVELPTAQIKCDNLHILKLDSDVYSIRFNITCIDERKFLFNEWNIYINNVHKDNVLEIDCSVIDKIFNLSKVYYFQNSTQVYTITFPFSFSNNRAYLKIKATHSLVLKDNEVAFPARKSFGRVLKLLEKNCASLVFFILFKLHRHKSVAFYSDTQSKLSLQLKLLSEEYKNRPNTPLESFLFSSDLSKGVGKNLFKYLKALLELSKAEYIVIDNYSFLLAGLKLPSRIKIIQLWHANEGFKSVGYSRFGLEGSPSLTSFYKSIYKVLVLNESIIPVYEEVLGIEKSAFLPWGRINSRFLVDQNNKSVISEKLYSQYPILKGKEIILFSPTYRGAEQSNAYYDFSTLDFDKLYQSLNGNQLFVIKMHPFVTNMKDLSLPREYEKKILVLDSGTVIDELYFVTDILITDYSSAYSDFAIFKKPIIFFTPDRVEYQYSRGVNHDILSYAPGKICDTFEELLSSLKEKDYNLNKTIQYSEEMYRDIKTDTVEKLIDFIVSGS
jgi:CDP-ribitol ribitolphosphotransferase